MDAAEKLFSAAGFEGVSIRSVNAAAGFAPVAVHYHFRSKERLLEAVVLRRGKGVARRAAELLDALEAGGRVPTAHDVIKVIATPYRELLQCNPVGGLRWLRLLARLVLAQDPRLFRLNAGPKGLVQRLSSLVRWAFPGVPEQALETAWRLSSGIIILMLVNSDARMLGAGGRGRHVSVSYADMLIDLVSTGFADILERNRGVVSEPSTAHSAPTTRAKRSPPVRRRRYFNV